MAIDSERVSKARTILAEVKLDGLVCRLPENILLLSGYWPMNGFAALVFPTYAEPILIAPEAEAELAAESWVGDVRLFKWGLVDRGDPFEQIGELLTRAATECQLVNRRIGYEGSFEFVAAPFVSAEPSVISGRTIALLRAAFGTTLVDATDIIHDLRLHKTTAEVERLRIAHAIARIGLQAFVEHVEPGRSEIEIAIAVEASIARGGTGYQGIRVARGWASVMSGPRAAAAYKPHLLSTQRVLEQGDLALLELAVVADGWWADLTRTRAAGHALPLDCERWEVVVTAQQAACAATGHGVPSNIVDAAARMIIEQHGLGQYFIHHTGHGLGLRYHEPTPFLHPSVSAPLEAGMVTSVEPGIYIAGWGGMRCEDNVLITNDGAEILSEFPRRLDG